MKYIISRASNYNDLSDPKFPEAYQSDKHHAWYANIDSLEELDEKLRSIDKPAIIYPSHYWEESQMLPEIVIYDDYIE